MISLIIKHFWSPNHSGQKKKNLIFDGDGGVGVANCPTCRWSLYCHLDFWCWCCIESWCLLSSPPTGSRSPYSSLANCTSSGRRPRPCKPKLFHPTFSLSCIFVPVPVQVHTFSFTLFTFFLHSFIVNRRGWLPTMGKWWVGEIIEKFRRPVVRTPLSLKRRGSKTGVSKSGVRQCIHVLAQTLLKNW